MIHKLGLSFPLLSDPDRSAAIEPYGVADPKDQRNLARPAIVVVGPDLEERFRIESSDFADRPPEDELIESLHMMEIPPVVQPPPDIGPAQPGARAVSLEALTPYYRGARFAAVAMSLRHPEVADDAEAYVAQMDRYAAAVKDLLER
jgi:hypothetical protein